MKPEISFHKSLWETPELGLDSWFSSFKLRFSGRVGGGGVPASVPPFPPAHAWEQDLYLEALRWGEHQRNQTSQKGTFKACVCGQTHADLGEGVAFRS